LEGCLGFLSRQPRFYYQIAVRVSLEDNVQSFDVEKVQEKGGMGRKVIRDRVQMLGGAMEIHSTIGNCTYILFQLPATNAAAFA
jgi:signal transduction histidine kinase